MLKTVKNGSGIRVDPPPVFFKIPTFSRFFLGGASLSIIVIIIAVNQKRISRECSQNLVSPGIDRGFKPKVGKCLIDTIPAGGHF